MLLFLGCNVFASEKPNVIFILADDMGHGDVVELNSECKFPTPNLDRLAREGMAFTQAYTGSSICTPTRYGLMTGRYCWRENIGLAGNYASRRLVENQQTVANLFRSQGYKTHCVGKWHLGTSWTYKDGSIQEDFVRIKDDMDIDFTADFHGGPVDHGFDTWFGIAGSLDFAPYVYLKDRCATKVPSERVPADATKGRKHRFGQRSGLADPDLQPNQVLGDFTREAVRVIGQQNADQPFFLYMPLNAPHSPTCPSPDFVGKSGMNEHADIRMEIDWCVGQVLQALEEKGLDENTLIIFSADNGSHSGPSRTLPAFGHDTHDGRRGQKAMLFEGGHRVPFLVRWPGGLKGELNRRDTRNITLEDFVATCAEILGTETPIHAVDSLSFLPQLKNKEPHEGQRQAIFSSLGGTVIVRKDEWKLILKSEAYLVAREKGKHQSLKDDPDAPWFEQVTLYNLKNDVAETTNVARQNPERVGLLLRYLEAAIENGRSTVGAPQSKPDINDSKVQFMKFLKENVK